jgi:translation initiation factor 2B subunit (eIF-2B alpha/beta/delta family)
MAGALSRLGYRATVVVDAALPALAAGAPAPAAVGWAAHETLVLLGCDAVGPGGFVNKVGSFGLARAAVRAGVPVLVIAASRKLLPFDPPLPSERGVSAGEEVERLRFDFERVPLEALTWCLVEDGALDPAALRARIASLPALDGELWNRLLRARRGDAT